MQQVPVHFMEAMRELASNDKERARLLRMGRVTAQRLREGKLPPAFRKVFSHQSLAEAICKDAHEGNIAPLPDPTLPTT